MSRHFDVFVSHSSVDKPWVHRLITDLKRYGVSVWLDENEIRPGDLFVKALEQGIEQSRAVALVVSPESMASGWVEQEYSRAVMLAQRKTDPLQLIPVLRRTAELPGFLAIRHAVNFHDDTQYSQNVRRLVWGITGEEPTQVLDLDMNALPPLAGEHIPEPAPLPPGSRMHMMRNPLFVGRLDELSNLAEALQVQGTAAISQVASVTGLGGIGKTQLATEFVHRYGQFFPGGVFWLSFAEPASVPVEVAQCGGPGHLGLWSTDAAPDLTTQLTMVRTAWNLPVARLLVFDNCEDEDLLKDWRPTSGGCRVLVTCRRHEFSEYLGVRLLELGVLPREESLKLLRSFSRDQLLDPAGEQVLNAICAELGDLPLALHLAGSFLARYRSVITPVKYLDQLHDDKLLGHSSLQGKGTKSLPTQHELHVGRTFALSWDRLDPEHDIDVLAGYLLQCVACLAPGEPIPRAQLIAMLSSPEDDPDAVFAFEDTLRRLLELGLLDQPEVGTYRIHRLVASFVQQVDGNHLATRAAVEQVLLHEAKHVTDLGLPVLLLPWQPHLRAVTDMAREREDQQAAHLCDVLGYHLREIGDYHSARAYSERALAICEKQFGPEHVHTAANLNNLALLLHVQGEHDEARALYERALAIREKQLGPDHPDTATSLNNLAALLRAQGNSAEARPLYERALAICEKQLGLDHPHTAASLNNLAMLLQDQGAYAEARPLLERALAVREEQLGPDHPDTAQSVHNLAWMLEEQGARAEARLLYERALAIYEKQLGPDHPATAKTLGTLATLLQEQRAYAEARPLHERGLAICEKQLGPEHPDTAQSLNNLAALLQAQGAYAEARPLFERALAICETRLGPDHPGTRTVRENLQSLPKS
jgi:tetratricopeptide (TPR) repeat protein